MFGTYAMLIDFDYLSEMTERKNNSAVVGTCGNREEEGSCRKGNHYYYMLEQIGKIITETKLIYLKVNHNSMMIFRTNEMGNTVL